MLFRRIHEASHDPLTGRIGLFIFGAMLAAGSLALWTNPLASTNAGYAVLFIACGLLGAYLLGLAIFSRKQRGHAVLLSRFARPLGLVCLAIAMPLASIVRKLNARGRQ